METTKFQQTSSTAYIAKGRTFFNGLAKYFLVLPMMILLCACPAPADLAVNVLDKENSNQPISGAKVEVQGKELSGTTIEGRYRFQEIGDGSYVLKITHEDYEEHTSPAITVNGDDENYTAYLTPKSYSYTGTVKDALDNSILVSGVSVTAASGASATTNSSGQFSLTGLKKGSTTITLKHKDYKDQSAEINPQTTATGDFTLEPIVTSLELTISNSKTSAAIQSADVKLDNETKSTGSDGKVTFTNLRKTSYVLVVSKTGFTTVTKTVTVKLDTDKNTELVPLTPQTTSLSGKITSCLGTPISGATVKLSSGEQATTGSDGSYSISDLSSGTVTLTVTASGYGTYTSGSITLNTSNASHTHNVSNMTPTTLSLKVKVVDVNGNAALSGATVTLNTGESGTTNGSGEYTFSGLTGTSYTVSASKSGYDNNSATASDLSFCSTNNNVTVTLKETVVVPTYKTITGKVTKSGATTLLSGVAITIKNTSGTTIGTTTTNTSGVYTYSTIPDNTTAVTLTATLSGYNTYTSGTIPTTATSTSYNFAMVATSTECIDANATVTIYDYVALTTAIAVDLDPDGDDYVGGSTTAYYRAGFYSTSYTDAEIITDLSSGSQNPTSAWLIWNSGTMSANSTWKFAVLGFNSSGCRGNLTTKTITTKSSSSQPRVTLTASVNSTQIPITATMNSYCSYYGLWAFSTNYDWYDPELAYFIYYNMKTTASYKQTANLTTGSYYNKNSSYTYFYLAALGYTSSSVNSGYIDVKIINQSTNTVIRSSATESGIGIGVMKADAKEATKVTTRKRSDFTINNLQKIQLQQ